VRKRNSIGKTGARGEGKGPVGEHGEVDGVVQRPAQEKNEAWWASHENYILYAEQGGALALDPPSPLDPH